MNICIDGVEIEVSTHPIYSFYATSRDGKVFTQPAVRVRSGLPRGGSYPREDHWKEIATFIIQPKNTPPYRKCRVTQDGVSKLVSVHRFMLECWDSIQPRTIIVRHLDGKSLHNTLDNLKYGTVKENVDDAFKHTGNYAEGSNNGRHKLTEEDVRTIRARYDSGTPVIVICRDYPAVWSTTVESAAKRRTWVHIV